MRDFRHDVPLRSKIGNVISRYVYRFLIGLKLSDTQTGLRGIPRRLAEFSLRIRANRYEFETEQLIVLTNERIGFREIPDPDDLYRRQPGIRISGRFTIP